MARSSTGVSRRCRNGQRTHKLTVRLSDTEKTAVKGAADRAGLAVGAWIGETAVNAAEHRVGPVRGVYRDLLAEMNRVSGLLNQAVAGLPEGNAAASAACAQAARQAERAVQRVAQVLPR